MGVGEEGRGCSGDGLLLGARDLPLRSVGGSSRASSLTCRSGGVQRGVVLGLSVRSGEVVPTGGAVNGVDLSIPLVWVICCEGLRC